MNSSFSFGKTWWGRKWIEAMERIDYDTNRLPRGRAYARNGSVLKIDIKESKIFAKVQGRLAEPYDISIKLKEFNKNEINKITDIVSSNPSIASELNLGKLPSKVLEILENEKINLLPESWNDITAKCSCPDWANPCKHLAAVYYIISNEIDKDPFILFNLRGLETKELIKAAGFSFENLFEKRKEKLFSAPEFINFKNFKLKEDIEEIDLNFKPLNISSLFALLQPKPLFYQFGDFKEILYKVYENVIKNIKDIKTEEEISFKNIDFFLKFSEKGKNFFVCPEINYFKGKNSSLNVPFLFEDKIRIEKAKGLLLNLEDVFDLFLKIPLNISLENNSISSRFLNFATSVALSLVKSCLFLPEVELKENGSFSINYFPIVEEEKVKKTIEILKSIMPLNFGFREDGFLLKPDGVLEIISLIIKNIVIKFSDINVEDKILNTFFKGKIYKANKFEEMQTAKAVSSWISTVSMRKSPIQPVIKIDKLKDEFFEINIDIQNKEDPFSPIYPLSKLFSGEDKIFSLPLEIIKTEVSKQISISAEYFPQLIRILDKKGKESVIIGMDEMAQVLDKTSGILNVLGIKIIFPKELKKLSEIKLSVKSHFKEKKDTISYLDLENILDFSWEISISDKSISKEEFFKLVKSAKDLVRFKDEYLLIKPEEVQSIIEKLNKPFPKKSSMEILQASFLGEMDGFDFKLNDALKKFIENIKSIKEIKVPKELKGILRHYQERGFKWLYKNTINGFGSCLADDMGLGKTIQVIALILKLKEEKYLEKMPVLVVCPTTLIGNWYKEILRFAPSLKVSIYHGTERILERKGVDIVLTSYGILRKDLKKFKDFHWGLLVIDEAQNIKNPETDQTRAVKSIKAKAYIAMSGTPVENRLTELWSIYDFLNKGYLGKIKDFRQKFAIPIEKYREKEKIEKFQKIISPFLLRRSKADKEIISDLPDKIIYEEYCYLTKEQAALYKEVVDTIMRGIEESKGIERKGLIFKLITSLKQICNHPIHYLKKGKPLKHLSGKSEKTIDLIEKILKLKEKVIIFTQYKEMASLLVEMIKLELNKDCFFFYGGLSRKARDKMVEDFQKKDDCQIMVISLKAGGVGLNLTSATNVIHYDLWWNPAVEAQATDRSYRIGQKKNVIVHRLLTIGTFEEKIDEMLKKKQELADLSISKGEIFLTELTNKELKEIFYLTKES